MKTRTLLLLAIGCGLAILIAGGIQLLRVSEQSEAAAPLGLGTTVTIGSLQVTVTDAREVGDLVVVTLTAGGTADDLAGRFFLDAREPVSLPASAGTPCGLVGVPLTTCSLAFERRNELAESTIVYTGRRPTVRWSLA